MTKKDPKDLLREIKADIKGVPPEDIHFKDLRQKTTKKNKNEKRVENKNDSDIITNDEGFSVSGIGTNFCDYRDIGSKRKLTRKNSLDEWGAFDFFQFAHKLYFEKYKKNWNLNMGGSSLEINRIRDKFYDNFGFCCNLIMKDYIIYFFDNRIDDCIEKFGGFYFNLMRKDWVIEDFVKNYNFRDRFASYISGKKNRNIKNELTKESINKAFLIGDTTLVGNYGVVIALNWLLIVKKMPKKEAVELVVNACKDMEERGLGEVVKRSTEAYSPYSSNMLFTSPQLIFNKFNKNAQLKVVFSEKSDIMKFLQKGN